ncbi:ImpA family type VI secretion system protein [Tritonibacter scottomollicae]|uniref:type VI secretion system protein TssA n=1 Tax=Tritonibacter scottomollicae TaxID=483013 RepID=UPI003BA98AE0
MIVDDILIPISADAPCGPDLDASWDDTYGEYYFDAEGRLPERYFTPGTELPGSEQQPDKVFDPVADVNLQAEITQIDSLLSRSRDLRLLVLRAKWQALAGEIGDLADTFEMIAGCLEVFGPDLHPRIESAARERREAINDLASQMALLQPLTFLPLSASGDVSLRRIKVAEGHLKPLQKEQDLEADTLYGLLRDPANGARISFVLEAIGRIQAALERIQVASQRSTGGQTPKLDPLNEVLTEMIAAVKKARPDLVKDAPQGGGAAGGAADPSATAPSEAGPPMMPAAVNAPKVESHDHARALLEQVEHYYRREEPSSAALLLVTQARLLIGKTLVEAITTLLPGRAAEAKIDFGPASGFVIDYNRLETLSTTQPTDPTRDSRSRPPKVSPIPSGQEAADVLLGVEAYFRHAEKSSPVPLLLSRARRYVDQEFESILTDLLGGAEKSAP